MHRTKIILYGVGIALIITGFLMIVYGEIRLNTAYNCIPMGCTTSPDWIYDTVTIPSIITYSGIVVMIVGVICIIIGRKKGGHAINNVGHA
jgi:energy-converting hydrogenase Eha subunit E